MTARLETFAINLYLGVATMLIQAISFQPLPLEVSIHHCILVQEISDCILTKPSIFLGQKQEIRIMGIF